MITLHHGPKWKYIRSLLVTVTGPSKLKEFTGHLANAATTCMKKLDQVSENGKKFDAFRYCLISQTNEVFHQGFL